VGSALGDEAETIAKHYLQTQGLTPVIDNFRCRLGEIDLIMRDHKILVFIEVRYRKSIAHGSALASVTPHKQTRIIRAAQFYLANNSNPPACRFDVVALEGNLANPSIQWLKHAFELGGDW